MISQFNRILQYFRWLLRIDWELIDLERCEHKNNFMPWFIETWQCKKTGAKKILDIW